MSQWTRYIEARSKERAANQGCSNTNRLSFMSHHTTKADLVYIKWAEPFMVCYQTSDQKWKKWKKWTMSPMRRDGAVTLTLCLCWYWSSSRYNDVGKNEETFDSAKVLLKKCLKLLIKKRILDLESIGTSPGVKWDLIWAGLDWRGPDIRLGLNNMSY